MNSASEPPSRLRSGWTRSTSFRYAFLMASLLAPGATPSLLKGSASATAKEAACKEGSPQRMSQCCCPSWGGPCSGMLPHAT